MACTFYRTPVRTGLALLLADRKDLMVKSPVNGDPIHINVLNTMMFIDKLRAELAKDKINNVTIYPRQSTGGPGAADANEVAAYSAMISTEYREVNTPSHTTYHVFSDTAYISTTSGQRVTFPLTSLPNMHFNCFATIEELDSHLKKAFNIHPGRYPCVSFPGQRETDHLIMKASLKAAGNALYFALQKDRLSDPRIKSVIVVPGNTTGVVMDARNRSTPVDPAHCDVVVEPEGHILYRRKAFVIGNIELCYASSEVGGLTFEYQLEPAICGEETLSG